MTRGPGRHSERNFHAADRYYNAVEWPTDADSTAQIVQEI